MAVTHCLVGVLLIALVASGQEVGVGDINEQMTGTSMQQVPSFMGKLMNSNLPCTFCEEFFDFLLNVTTCKTTLEGIEELALTVCDVVPYIVYEDCRDFAKSLPGLIDALAKEYLDGETNCAYICTSKGHGGIPEVMSLVNLMKSMPKKPIDN